MKIILNLLIVYTIKVKKNKGKARVKPICIITYASLKKKTQEMLDRKFGLIIYDECHRSSNENQRRIAQSFIQSKLNNPSMLPLVFGFSGTPGKSKEIFKRNELYFYPILEGMADKILTPCVSVYFKPDYSKLQTLPEQQDEMTAQAKENLSDRKTKFYAKIVADIYANCNDTCGLSIFGRKTIVFANDIRTANIICETLNQQLKNCNAGYDIACVITSEKASSSNNTQKKINQFKNGEYSIAVNVSILKEGFDYADLEFAFLLSTLKNKKELIQAVGRILRGIGEKELAHLFQIADGKTGKIYADIVPEFYPLELDTEEGLTRHNNLKMYTDCNEEIANSYKLVCPKLEAQKVSVEKNKIISDLHHAIEDDLELFTQEDNPPSQYFYSNDYEKFTFRPEANNGVGDEDRAGNWGWLAINETRESFNKLLLTGVYNPDIYELVGHQIRNDLANGQLKLSNRNLTKLQSLVDAYSNAQANLNFFRYQHENNLTDETYTNLQLAQHQLIKADKDIESFCHKPKIFKEYIAINLSTGWLGDYLLLAWAHMTDTSLRIWKIKDAQHNLIHAPMELSHQSSKDNATVIEIFHNGYYYEKLLMVHRENIIPRLPAHGTMFGSGDNHIEVPSPTISHLFK